MRSLPKNIDKSFHYISELNTYPDVTVITETKLYYLNIYNDDHNLMYNDSKTNGADVGTYIINSVKYKISKQINLDLKNNENF